MPINKRHPNYDLLRKNIVEHRSPVVFWIGAGVSADANLPSWAALRKTFADAALEELVSIPSEEADEKEALLEQATNTDDLWSSFDVLRDLLGHPTFKALIRQSLSNADQNEIPKLHKEIWSLEAVRGVVSLNIDGLEGRAQRLARPGETCVEFVGRDIRNHLHTLKDRRPFIARLHGHHTDSSSWVFTSKELGALTKDGAYEAAIRSIFSSYTVIFLGISAEDVAAGGFLAAMTHIGLDSGSHYWITNRTDKATTDWCNQAGLLRVPYSVDPEESHTSVLVEMFADFRTFKSKDQEASPIVYPGVPQERIGTLEDLRALPENKARIALNQHARHLLDVGAGRTDTHAYQSFLVGYSPIIHQAWHLSEHQGYNEFFEYKAVERVHSGPFSSVWRVQDAGGSQFALKIIQIDNLRKGAQLDSFRRGIASQKLLRDTGVDGGVAKIEAAFEIPPSVVMEFIEGENLEAISSKPTFEFWSDGLEIVKNVCVVVEGAHRSKYGVLHRDIRPQNVMLPNFYYGDSAGDYGLQKNEVRLLNYDMTWHKDASGRVIPVDPLSVGYFSPELLNEPDGTRARDARVDSYGIGMTLFRLAAGKNPPVGGSTSSEWRSYLDSIKPPRQIWFNSCHNYVSRIIDSATRIATNERASVGDIAIALDQLIRAIAAGVGAAEGKFLAENLMFAVCRDDFEVGPVSGVFKRNLNGYRFYQVEFDGKRDRVLLLFTNTSINTEDWGKIDKAWSGKLTQAKEILVSGGWQPGADTQYSQKVITLSANIDLEILRANYTQAEDTLVRALSRLQSS